MKNDQQIEAQIIVDKIIESKQKTLIWHGAQYAKENKQPIVFMVELHQQLVSDAPIQMRRALGNEISDEIIAFITKYNL